MNKEQTITGIIRGTGACVPKRVLDNNEIAGFVDTSDEWIREDTHPTGPQPVRELCELHVVEVQKQRIAQHRRGAGKGRICPIRIGQSPLLENEYGFRSVLVEYA